MTLELAELDSPALQTELDQLEEPALEKATFSFELCTAHLHHGKLWQPFVARILDNPGPRGVLKPQLPVTSLTVNQLVLDHNLVAQAVLSFHQKGSLSPKLSSF